MDGAEKHERKRLARMRLRAQRRRAGELRGRVVALSLVAFALLWAIVFAQMATGNDPVLSEKQNAAAGARRKPHSERSAGPVLGPAAPEPTELETEGDLALEEEELEAELERELELELIEAESEAAEVEPEPVITGQS